MSEVQEDAPPWASRYAVVGKLGSGGFASVHRARDLGTGDEVALKVLLETVDPDNLARLQREIRILQALDCPSIVSVLDADPVGRWYTMPIASCHLEAKAPTLDSCERAQVVEDVAVALAAAHAAKVVHRDVSPRNILWFEDERRWKLSDFGLARRFPGHTTRVVTDHAVAWTWLFAAPELEIDPHAVDQRCDVFSLGQVAGWLVSGRNPSPQSQFVLGDGPWKGIVAKMTSRSRVERQYDGAAVLEDVRAVSGVLRSSNHAIWNEGMHASAGAQPLSVDRVTGCLLRYLFTNGAEAEWSLMNSATSMGLSKEGVRVGLLRALGAGLVERRTMEHEGEGWHAMVLTSEGERLLINTFSEDELLAPQPSPFVGSDIPF